MTRIEYDVLKVYIRSELLNDEHNYSDNIKPQQKKSTELSSSGK